MGAKLGAIRGGFRRTAVHPGGLERFVPSCRTDSRKHLWTSLGDLRIRRLGVRVAPGAPRKALVEQISARMRVPPPWSLLMPWERSLGAIPHQNAGTEGEMRPWLRGFCMRQGRSIF
jgi:hypothetical protein